MRIKAQGDGVKLQPEFQDFYADDKKMFPVYGVMEALGLPLLFHCGEELSGSMKVRSSPLRILHIRERFPNLTIIAAHFGGFMLWDEVRKYLIGKDVYFDTSFFFEYLDQEQVKEMILAHPKDRLLFGTDFPLVDQEKDLRCLEGLGLPQDVKELILFRNAQALLHL